MAIIDETLYGIKGKQIKDLASRIKNNAGNISNIEAKIPSAASSSNQLADKEYVNDAVSTQSAHFRGSWPTWSQVPTDASQYPADDGGIHTPTSNDYMVVADASGYPTSPDPALEGTWRFKYAGIWSVNGKAGWTPEYQVNESPLTPAQVAALDSGITATDVTKLSGIEAGAEVNVQADWDQSDNAADDYIKNKPTLPNVVQAAGNSTTDIMSQNAVTSMVFSDPTTQGRVQIGPGANSSDTDTIAIGYYAQSTNGRNIAIGRRTYADGGTGAIAIGAASNTGYVRASGGASIAIGSPATSSSDGSVALGLRASASAAGAVAIGSSSEASVKGTVSIGDIPSSYQTAYGYNNSAYRLFTGVYDGQSAHDACTKGQLDTAIINGGTTAPTTSTVGAVGTLYAYVDITGTPTVRLCVCTEVSGSTYTWSALATVASTGSYNDLSNQPTIPTITMTDTDPGEGQPLEANHFIAVY